MDFCLYLITDRRVTHGGKSIEDVLDRAFDSGVRGMLLREKDMPSDELLSLARRVRDITRRHQVRMLISGRADIVAEVDADGVQLTSNAPDIEAARKLLGDEKYVAVSTHSLAEAKSAESAGADFVTFGPVYETPSKIVYGQPAGIDKLEEVCKALSIPVFALGGINEENAHFAMRAGAYGVAVISAVISAEDPGIAVKKLIDGIRSYKLGKLI